MRFFLCAGAQLSWGFLAFGSVLSVALLGGWSLFGTFAGLLGLWALSLGGNSSFGLMGLLVTLRFLGVFVSCTMDSCGSPPCPFVLDLALSPSLAQLGASALSPTYERKTMCFVSVS